MMDPPCSRVQLGIAVLTVSDSRTLDTDTSGQFLGDAVRTAGHRLIERRLTPDDIYLIRARVSDWAIDSRVQVMLITGGTGFTTRDSTPEAVRPLLDKQIEGFGELFRYLSLQEIGTSTIQSRAFAGLINRRLVFCLPGSNNACRTAWEQIIRQQLDSTHRPCNFAAVLTATQHPGPPA